MRYGTYNGCRDYNALQQFEKFDLTQYEFLPPQPTAFKGKVASVIQTEGNYGLQWNVTMVNSERNQKCSFYIPADATSMLAQQLLLLTTGNLESNEKTVTTKNGESMTFVDNIKGEVVVTLAYMGQSKKDVPIFKALHFFNVKGFSLEEIQAGVQNPTHWKQSFELAKKITMEVFNERQQQAQTAQKFAPQNVPQPQSQPVAQQVTAPQNNAFSIQGAEQGQPDEDIPF